jgi:ubiquitin thioesterase protein OTUB1
VLTPHSGHFDILYKAEDVPQPIPAQAPLQVHLASYDDFIPTTSSAADIMTMIPGMGPTGFGQNWASLSYDFGRPSPAPQPQIASLVPYPSATTPATPVSSSQLDFIMPSQPSHASQYNPPSHHSIHLDQPPITLAIHPPPPVSIERAAPAGIERGGPFRPSMYELEPGFGSGMQVQPFQTSIFRK